MKNAKKEYGKWYDLIPKEHFKEVDINKVKIGEEVHLNGKVSIFNMKRYQKNKNKPIHPIAVRENENGEYELVAGIKSFIIAKLFSRNVKAYVTNLSRDEFKEKYSLDI